MPCLRLTGTGLTIVLNTLTTVIASFNSVSLNFCVVVRGMLTVRVRSQSWKTARVSLTVLQKKILNDNDVIEGPDGEPTGMEEERRQKHDTGIHTIVVASAATSSTTSILGSTLDLLGSIPLAMSSSWPVYSPCGRRRFSVGVQFRVIAYNKGTEALMSERIARKCTATGRSLDGRRKESGDERK